MQLFLKSGKTAAIVVFCAVSGIVFFKYQDILQIMGDYLIISDSLKNADIIHVIAGEDHRTLYGIKLYKQGYAKLLFFTGGWCKTEKNYHGQRAKGIAVQSGLDQTAIAVDDTHVTSTYAEAVRLKRFIAKQRETISSVIVVSDAYHMRRVRWTYRNIFGAKIKIQLAPVPLPSSPYTRQWWRDQETSLFVVQEYIKFFYYYLRYQISSGRFKDWLARLDRY